MKPEPTTRPLTGAERRLLRCRLRRLRSESGGGWKATAIVTAALWLATLLASDASWIVVTGFWLLIGGLIHAWAFRDARRTAAAMGSALESALRRGEAASHDVSAVGFAELEEVEDEGACYAFDLGDGRLLFLAGQQYYPGARFPCLEFSVVHPLDERGGTADEWIVKRSPRATPDRVVPADVKARLADRLPESLTIVPGTLQGLEDALGRRR